MKETIPEEWVPAPKAAKLAGVSEKALGGLTVDGKLDRKRDEAGKWLYSVLSIEAHLSLGEQGMKIDFMPPPGFAAEPEDFKTPTADVIAPTRLSAPGEKRIALLVECGLCGVMPEDEALRRIGAEVGMAL